MNQEKKNNRSIIGMTLIMAAIIIILLLLRSCSNGKNVENTKTANTASGAKIERISFTYFDHDAVINGGSKNENKQEESECVVYEFISGESNFVLSDKNNTITEETTDKTNNGIIEGTKEEAKEEAKCHSSI